jgi:phosphoenolpyruvate-protein kinase (PTS system EI component)
MAELRGVGIGQGVAQGPVVRMAEALPAPENTPSTAGADAERARARDAVAAVASELQQRAETAGGSAQEVLEAQAMIAEDPTLEDEVDSRIDDGATAEWAVHDAFAGFRATLEAVGGYLGERAAWCRRSRCARPGASVRAPRTRSRPRRYGAAQARPGARTDHHGRRPDLAHGDPRA